MAGDEIDLVDSFADISALNKEKQSFIDILDAVTSAFNETIAARDKLSGSPLKLADIVANSQQTIQTTDALTKSLTNLKSAADAANKSTSNSSGSGSGASGINDQVKATKELSQAQAEYNLILKSVNADTTTAAKQALGLTNAYDQLAAQFKEATRAAQGLQAAALTDPALQSSADEASAKAAALNNQLKAIDAGIGNYQRNVGNYTGAVNVLKESLGNATLALEQMTQAGTANSTEGQALAKEVEQLSLLVGTQSNGFQSLTREVLTTGKQLETLQFQLQQLQKQGLEDSEAFTQLKTTIAELTPIFTEAKQSLTQLQQAQKITASQAPTLTALTVAAKGLGGAYAVGAGAAALFAGDNEKVQKTINDLVAVMTLLQGLQAVNELLLEKNAIAMVLFGESVVMTTTELGFFAGALEFIEANPIILALTVLVGALILVANAFESDAEQAAKAAKAVQDYSDAVKGTTDATKDLVTQNNRNLEDAKAGLEDQLSILEANNGSIQDQLDLKTRIAVIDKQINDNQLTDNPKVLGQLSDLNDELTKRLTIQQAQSAEVERLAKLKRSGIYDSGIVTPVSSFSGLIPRDESTSDALTSAITNKKANDDAITSLKASIADATGIKNDARKADVTATDAQLAQLAQTLKDQRLLILTEAQDEATIAEDKNKNILANDQTSFATRIATLKNNAAIEKQLALAQENNVTNDPANRNADGTLNAAGLAAEKDYQTKIATIDADSHEAIRAETEKYLKEIAQSKLDFYDNDLATDSKHQKDLSSSTALGLDDRMAAYAKYYKDEQNTVIADANFQLQFGNLNAQQKITLQEKTNNALLVLQQQSQKDISAIFVSQLNADATLQVAKDKATLAQKELDLLNSLKDQKDALTKFNNQKKQLDDEESANELKTDITNDQAILASTITTADAKAAANLDYYNKLAELRQKDLDDEIKKQEAIQKAQQETRDNEQKLAQLGFDFIQALGDAQYTNAINGIEGQKTTLDTLTQQQIAAENSTADAADVKAEKISVINATAAAKQQQLADEEQAYKVKQAKFDKAIGIAKIIESTAVAVIGALAEAPGPVGIALASTVGAIGAAELAIAIATPIPAFKRGLFGDYEGPAIVGDGGRSEVHTKPDGTFYITPDTPTMTNIDIGDRIYPSVNDWVNSVARSAYNGMPMPAAPGEDASALVANTIKSEIQGLKTAIMNKKEYHMYTTHRGQQLVLKQGYNYMTYRNNQTNWQK